MRLPDFARSQAVLIGTSSYRSAGLDDLPSVARNVRSLRELLIDTTVSGFPDDHCVAVIDPLTPGDLLAPLQQAANNADDVLLVYFSGHGLLTGKRHDLHLALTGTEDGQFWTSVPFQHVEDIIIGSSATAKIVILDCCYSGRALSTMMSDPVGVAVEQLAVEGLYVLTSCSGTKTSLAPEGDQFTAFTGCLLEVMRAGVPHPEEVLPMEVLFEYVTRRMRTAGLRKPQQKAGNTAGRLALVRNIYRPASEGFSPDQEPVDDQPLGSRIARLREHRRFSRLAFAQLLGRSESWVRRVENGTVRLDKLSALLQISDVLNIDLQTLIGRELNQRNAGFYSVDLFDVHEIRSVMERHYPTTAPPTAAAGAPRPADVQALVDDAWRHLDEARYGALSEHIPGLLTSALALDSAAGTAGPGAASLYSQAYQITSSVLRKVGEHELSWLAADRAAAAATRAGDEFLVGAAITRVSGALLSLGRVRSALEICVLHAGRFGPVDEDGASSPDSISVHGSLLLEAAMAGARIGDRSSVRDLLEKAESAARIVNRDENHYWTRFGPTGVELCRAATAVELGDGHSALEIHDAISSSRLDQLTPAVQGAHFLDMARAALLSADLRRAVGMLLEADRRAPAEVLCRPIAHEIVSDVLRRSRGGLPARMTELADQMGITTA